MSEWVSKWVLLRNAFQINSSFLTGDDNDEEEEEEEALSDSCSLKCGVGGSVAALSPVSRDILTDDFDVNSRR